VTASYPGLGGYDVADESRARRTKLAVVAANWSTPGVPLPAVATVVQSVRRLTDAEHRRKPDPTPAEPTHVAPPLSLTEWAPIPAVNNN